MSVTQVQFTHFRPHAATELDYDNLIDFLTLEFSEGNPDDPVPPRSGTHTRLKTLEDNPYNLNQVYIIHSQNGTAIGYLGLYRTDPSAPNYENEKHVAYSRLYIAPNYRNQGIGRQAVNFVVQTLENTPVTTLEGSSTFASGQAFALAIGANPAMEEFYARIQLADVDWQMMEQWREMGQSRNPDTKLVHFQGLYSEVDDELARFASFESAIRQDMPDGDLEGFIQVMTAEKLRQEIEIEQKRGVISDYFLSVEADGRFSGFTRINYRPEFGHYVAQRVTGVLASDRGRGLGKWLKAKMLFYIRNTYPDAQYIRTSYSNMNGSMISINKRVGFQVHKRQVYFKMTVEQAKQYLLR